MGHNHAVKRQIQHQQYFALLAPLGTLNADLYTVSYPRFIKTREELGNSSPMTKRAEGVDFPIPPEFWWSTAILFIINPSLGSALDNPSLDWQD